MNKGDTTSFIVHFLFSSFLNDPLRRSSILEKTGKGFEHHTRKFINIQYTFVASLGPAPFPPSFSLDLQRVSAFHPRAHTHTHTHTRRSSFVVRRSSSSDHWSLIYERSLQISDDDSFIGIVSVSVCLCVCVSVCLCVCVSVLISPSPTLHPSPPMMIFVYAWLHKQPLRVP
jgi:hypothetical protein